jgi:hypothetical protein
MTQRYRIEAISFLLYSVKHTTYEKYIPVTFMLVIVYLTALSVAQSIHRRMAKLLVNNKLERTWKKALFQNFLAKTDRALRKFCQNSRCHGRDQNRTPPECKHSFPLHLALVKLKLSFMKNYAYMLPTRTNIRNICDIADA